MRIGTSSRAISNRTQAFTLVEVVMAAALIALVYGGIINAYILSARRAEWSGYSLAAQASSIRVLEVAHAARWEAWDISHPNYIDQIQLNSNGFPAVSTNLLDLPISSTTKIMVTNYLSITTNANWAYYGQTGLKMLRVDAVWQLQTKLGAAPMLFSNSIQTYIAPDE